MKYKGQNVWIGLFLLPTSLVFALVFLYPLLTVLVTGFMKWNGFEAMQFVGLDNYISIFAEDTSFRYALFNTVIWGLMAALIHVPFGVIIALILHRRPFGWKFVRTVSLIPNIVSYAAISTLFLFIFNPSMGIVNSFIQLIGFEGFAHNWFYSTSTAFLTISMTWLFYTGVMILIAMAELSSIPAELTEAAKIDGASDWQINRYIHIPLLRNIIMAGMILAVSAVYKHFEVIYLTTGGGPGDATSNIALLIYSEITTNYAYGYANALGTLLLLIGILSILVIQALFRYRHSEV